MSSDLPRSVFALVLLAGCPGGGDGACTIDAHCSGGDVCARDGSCAAPGEVLVVRTTWTVGGQPASSTSCAPHPDLFINFIGFDLEDALGYAPVPCELGQYTIDKLPRRFHQVELGSELGPSRTAEIPASGVVTIDLP